MMKGFALADREAAIKVGDDDAQRAAEAEYNAVLAQEAAQRRQDALKARYKAEQNAERAGYDAAEHDRPSDAVRHVAKNLRTYWLRGFNAFWSQ